MRRRDALRRMFGLGAGGAAVATGAVPITTAEAGAVEMDDSPTVTFSRQREAPQPPGMFGPLYEPTGDEVAVEWSEDGSLWITKTKNGEIVDQRKLI